MILPNIPALPKSKSRHCSLPTNDDMTTERDIRNQIRYAEKKGREEQKLENARDLKRLGVAIDTIAQALGLSADEVQAL